MRRVAGRVHGAADTLTMRSNARESGLFTLPKKDFFACFYIADIKAKNLWHASCYTALRQLVAT
jgi:hypothetical protein